MFQHSDLPNHCGIILEKEIRRPSSHRHIATVLIKDCNNDIIEAYTDDPAMISKIEQSMLGSAISIWTIANDHHIRYFNRASVLPSKSIIKIKKTAHDHRMYDENTHLFF